MITIECKTCPYEVNDDDCQSEDCWCDKVGGKHFSYGWCNEIQNVELDRNKVRKRGYEKMNHYKNLIKHKQNGIRFACKSGDSDHYHDKVNYLNCIRENESGELYSQRCYVSKSRKYCKKRTNRKVRKSDVGNHGAYRKTFDYWYYIF